MKVTNGISIFGAAIFVPILALGLLQVWSVQGIFVSPTIHLVVSLMIAVSSVIVWQYGERGFQVSGSSRIIAIAFGLLFAGLLRFVAALFFDGGFGIPIDPARAEWYVRIASMALSLSLLLAVGFHEQNVPQAQRRRVMGASTFLFLVLLGIALMLTEGALSQDVSVAASVGRWTPLGRFLQIASIMFFTVTGLRYLYGAFLIRSEVALAFATGAVLFVMSELTSALSQEGYDAFFWAAQLWLVMGFLAFVWGGQASRTTHHEEAFAVSDKKP